MTSELWNINDDLEQISLTHNILSRLQILFQTFRFDVAIYGLTRLAGEMSARFSQLLLANLKNLKTGSKVTRLNPSQSNVAKL